MATIDAARAAQDYDELVTILQQMGPDQLRAVDDGSLPHWGAHCPTQVRQERSLLSWDAEGLELREAWVVYRDGRPQLSLRDDNLTLEA